MLKFTRSTNKNKKLVCVVCLLLAAVTLFISSSPVLAAGGYSGLNDANVTKLENTLAGIKKEINALQVKINNTKNDKNAALESKKLLDEQIKLTHDEIETTEQLIKTLTLSIAQTDAAIKVDEEAYAEKLANFKERLRINREEGNASYLEVIFGSVGLSEMFKRYDRIGSMIEYDISVMESLAEDKASLEAERAKLQADYDLQQQLMADLKAAEDELAAKAEEAAGYINRLLANENDFKAQLAEKEKERAKLDKELDDYVKELQKQNTKYVGGEFMWPVPLNYTYVSSECVWRTSPISGRKEFHNGIDIPVAFGTDIYASNGGTVKKSTWHDSYGYYVMIDHGGGYATLYAHNSKLLVSVGDEVERGQVIAKAGSTGDSTGNHCHFSIYENGAIINPRKYFPK